MTVKSIIMASASLAIDPPSLDLSFLVPGVLDPRITFTRASTGTYFDNTGLIQTASINTPRFDYDPNTLTLNGLLIEEARTNTFLQSGDFTNASWTKTNCTLAAGIAGPNGATTGSGIISNNAVPGFVTQPFVPVAGTTYTASCFAKMGSITSILIVFPVAWFTDATARSATFNLSTGTIAATVGTGAVGFIQPVGNGWYKVALSATPTIAVSASPQIARSPVNGDGVTIQHYVFGAQFVVGAFPTSYIPTTTSSVTRALDSAIMTTSLWYTNSAALSFVADILQSSQQGPTYMQFDDGTTANRAVIYSSPTFVATCFESSEGVTTFNSAALGFIPVGAPFKLGYATTAGQHQYAMNGAVGVASTNAAGPATFTTLRLGKSISPTTGSFYLRRARYWPRALSNSELQSVTK